jgi:hypothetical protein
MMKNRPTLTKLFDRWLSTNSDKFRYKPIHVTKNRYRFEGIIENVYLVLDEEDLASQIVFDNHEGSNCGDAYLDGIMTLCEDEKGFYDSDDEDRVYFNSYEEMIHERVFSYIVSYCDTHFVPNSKLYLSGDVCSMRYLICPNEEDKRGCKKLQTIIENGTYLGSKKPKDTLGVVKIVKYDLFDTTQKHETSYIRDERSTELLFEKWLEKNSDRFTYKPKRIKPSEYSFEGIIKNISLRVACEECSICFDDNDGEYFDHIDIEYIEYLDYKEGKGYYDEGTILYYIKRNLPIPYYPTYEDIIHQTLFETIINYCDKHFIKENSLYLMNSSGWRSASISPADNDKQELKQVEHLNKDSFSSDDKLLEDGTYDYKKLKFDLFDMGKDCEVFYYRKESE